MNENCLHTILFLFSWVEAERTHLIVPTQGIKSCKRLKERDLDDSKIELIQLQRILVLCQSKLM